MADHRKLEAYAKAYQIILGECAPSEIGEGEMCALDNALRYIPLRDKDIFEDRFGLHGKVRNLQEIARYNGLELEAVTRIEDRCKEILKSHLLFRKK